MPPGRDQVKAMERLVRILAVLDSAGRVGVTADRLVEVAAYGEGKHTKDQLSLDLRNLRKQGWQIDNVAPEGEPARYRMISGDNRLRVKLTDKQLVALQRAVLLSRRKDLAKRLGVAPGGLPEGIGVDVVPREESRELGLCHQAGPLRSRILFSYKGIPRVVHPGSVRFQNYRWYLSGMEEGVDFIKHFLVSAMSEVSLDLPGTAKPVPEVGRIPLHPLQWSIDEPTPVTVRTTPAHVPDVIRWLMEPDDQVEHGDVVDLRYTVTHRAAFRSRVYILGSRVTIADGGEVFDEMLDELSAMVGL